MLKIFENDKTFFDMSKAEVSLDIFRQRHVATTAVFTNPNYYPNPIIKFVNQSNLMMQICMFSYISNIQRQLT